MRFFTPTSEVPICGHATIAAHYVRATENHLDDTRLLQKTGAGILPVEIVRDGDDYQIIMTQGQISLENEITGEPLDRLLSALGLTRNLLQSDCPVRIVSTGHGKVMVGITDIAVLHQLQPDMEELKRVSSLIGCKGFFVFTLHPDEPVLVHGRMFAPAIGIPDDPVTGNANGPLGAYLCHYRLLPVQNGEASFNAMQGEAIRRTGTMQVRVKVENNEPVEVKIIGNAVIAFATTLTLEP